MTSLMKRLKNQGFRGAIFFCLCILIFGGSLTSTQAVKRNPPQNNATMSWDELQKCLDEVAHCSARNNDCSLPFSAQQLTDWLINCDYRDPLRKGKPTFTAGDFLSLSEKFPLCFARLFDFPNRDGTRDTFWAYKVDAGMAHEAGVSYQLKPRIEGPILSPIARAKNDAADEFNRHNPLEVPVSTVVNEIFPYIATHGYVASHDHVAKRDYTDKQGKVIKQGEVLIKKGELIANAGEWFDYFGPRVGLMHTADK